MVHWTQMDVFFVVGNAYRLLLPRSIVAGNGHPWASVTIYCGWQWPSMDRGHHLLWLAVVIDRHASRGGLHIIYIYID